MAKTIFLCIPALFLLLAGCGTDPLEADQAARVGNRIITMEDIDAEINRIPPYQRTSFESLRGKRALLDHIIERELLILAALDAGLKPIPRLLPLQAIPRG